jgi:hypothetical protein
VISASQLRTQMLEISARLAETALDLTGSIGVVADESVDYALTNEAGRIVKRLSTAQLRAIAEADEKDELYCPPARSAALHDFRLIVPRGKMHRLTELGRKVREMIETRGLA